MVNVDELSKQAPEQIRQQIVETRSSLAQKLETLESEVKDTVEVAKATVQEKVEDVKKAFDLRERIREKPWTFLGVSVLAGAASAVLFEGSARKISPALKRRVKERAEKLSVDGPTAKGVLTGLFLTILQDSVRLALQERPLKSDSRGKSDGDDNSHQVRSRQSPQPFSPDDA